MAHEFTEEQVEGLKFYYKILSYHLNKQRVALRATEIKCFHRKSSTKKSSFPDFKNFEIKEENKKMILHF